MAKTVIKFTAVPYAVGTGSQARSGYRPQLEPQAGLYDLDFCKEVVTEKRLAMSPDELLHAMEMVGEVGPAKVATDGRPRGITKLLKFNRYAQGNLESPTSPWNETCKAYVRAQLMWDAEKIIDASFQNVNSGIGVKLNYVAWVGAQTVTNVVKINKQIGVYGNHMEFITGDTATLTVGTTAYPLTCVESDVAHAVFSWPSGLAPEEGTLAEFLMLSRGGIEDGQVYTSKKTVTVLAADPTPTLPKLKINGLASRLEGASATTTMTIENAESALGYNPSGAGGFAHIAGYVKINNGEYAEADLMSDGTTWGTNVNGAEAGDTITVKVVHNPAKTAYDPADATASAVVTES